MDATTIIAISTVAYTIGTFLLWWTTRSVINQSEKTSKLSEAAFKLNIPVTLIGIHRPTYGTDNALFKVDQEAYDAIRRAASTALRK